MDQDKYNKYNKLDGYMLPEAYRDRSQVIEDAYMNADLSGSVNYSKLQSIDDGCLFLPLIEQDGYGWHEYKKPPVNVYLAALKQIELCRANVVKHKVWKCTIPMKHIIGSQYDLKYVIENYLKIINLIFSDLKLKAIQIDIDYNSDIQYSRRMLKLIFYTHSNIIISTLKADGTSDYNNITSRMKKFTHFNQSLYERLIKYNLVVVINPQKDVKDRYSWEIARGAKPDKMMFDQLHHRYESTIKERIMELIKCLKFRLHLNKDIITLIVVHYCLDCCSFNDLNLDNDAF